MGSMFSGGQFNGSNGFNQDISNWNTSSVMYMDAMFYRASLFNQDLSEWDISNVKTVDIMFENSLVEGNEPVWYNKLNSKVYR